MTTRRVPLLDLRRSDDPLRDELRAAFERVLDSAHFILGPEVERFERACEQTIGAKHALGVSSGTDALLLAFMALGIGPGDEVVLPSFTFFATAGCVSRTGATPVFTDVGREDFNMSVADIESKLTDRTRAIVVVHLFGQCADLAPILALAERRNIPVIEDAAQALGTTYGGRGAGTLGRVGCYSFFPSKNLGGFGDGGLVTTEDAALAEKMRILRAHGGKPKYYHAEIGGNFRLDALQAALLAVKLPHLGELCDARRANAARYDEMLKAASVSAPNDGGDMLREDVLLTPRALRDHIYNQYVVRVHAKQRDSLQRFLSERGVGTEVYYPVPMHLQKCFAALGHSRGDFPHSEALAAEALALPIFPGLRSSEQEWVVESIAEFYREARRTSR